MQHDVVLSRTGFSQELKHICSKKLLAGRIGITSWSKTQCWGSDWCPAGPSAVAGICQRQALSTWLSLSYRAAGSRDLQPLCLLETRVSQVLQSIFCHMALNSRERNGVVHNPPSLLPCSMQRGAFLPAFVPHHHLSYLWNGERQHYVLMETLCHLPSQLWACKKETALALARMSQWQRCRMESLVHSHIGWHVHLLLQPGEKLAQRGKGNANNHHGVIQKWARWAKRNRR